MTTTNQNPRAPGNQAVPNPEQDEATAALSRAEIERLHERIKQLEAERDAYRRAAYAWALERITDDELRRYAQNEEGLALDVFIGELERSAKVGKDA
jgi:hypothetical protein